MPRWWLVFSLPKLIICHDGERVASTKRSSELCVFFFDNIGCTLDTVAQYTPHIFKHRKNGTTRKHFRLWTQMPQVETHDVHSGSLFALNEICVLWVTSKILRHLMHMKASWSKLHIEHNWSNWNSVFWSKDVTIDSNCPRPRLASCVLAPGCWCPGLLWHGWRPGVSSVRVATDQLRCWYTECQVYSQP